LYYSVGYTFLHRLWAHHASTALMRLPYTLSEHWTKVLIIAAPVPHHVFDW
jgi:hypothetical protein